MDKVLARNLPVGTPLGSPLYHETGILLHTVGEILSTNHIKFMISSGINHVFSLKTQEEINQFIFFAEHKALNINQINPDNILKFPIYQRNGKMIAHKNTYISKDEISALKKKGILNVYVPHKIPIAKLSQIDSYKQKLTYIMNTKPVKPVKSKQKEKTISKEEETRRYIKTKLQIPSTRRIKTDKFKLTAGFVEKQLNKMDFKVKPIAPPLKKIITSPRRPRTEHWKKDMMQIAKDSSIQLNSVFQDIKDGKRSLKESAIENISKDIILGIMKDKDFLLNLANLKDESNYLVMHSIRVALISVAIATSMGYSPVQVMEIAYGAFMHDIGMIKVPKAITEKKGSLSPDEQKEIRKHPLYGLDLLQSIHNIPQSSPFITYQTHERADGSGYPHHKSGNMIHDFAKIVAIADIYDALTSSRPYRSALLPYNAMEKLLRLAGKKHIDPIILKAFLDYSSLFPIGSWVEIGDGHIGKVIASGGNENTKPTISLLIDPAGTPISPREIDLKKAPEIVIKKALSAKHYELNINYDGF